MDYIVLGSVKPGASRRSRLVALRNYLRRDPADCGPTTTRELWASHPDYFMVISATAETETAIWEELAPWHDVANFKVMPVQSMRETVEMHLSSPAVLAEQAPPAAPPRPVLAAVDPPNPLKDLLKAILETDTHDEPWPEEQYARSSVQMAAYLSIVEQLGGIEPKSGSLPSNAMGRVHKPPGIADDPWNEVYDHLVNELGSFEDVENWFGDKGHAKEFIEHMNSSNNATLRDIEQQTAMLAAIGLSPSQSVTMVLEVMLDFLGVAVAAVQPEAASVGIFLELAGEFLAKSGGGTSFTMNFGDVADAVAEQFERVDTEIEKSRDRLRNNWGRLNTFGFLVEMRRLQWPSDTSKMRASAARAFEIYLWQAVLPSLKNLYHWEYATYSPEVKITVPFDPTANAYAYGNFSRTTYQSGGCGSHPVQGIRNVTHQFGGAWSTIDNPYNFFFIPLPDDFLYRLLGSAPRPGNPHPLAISPSDFFAGDDDPSNPADNPNNPWTRIQLMRMGFQT